MTNRIFAQYRFAFLAVGLMIAVGFVFLFVDPLQAQGNSSLRVIQSDTDRVILELTISKYDLQMRNVGGRAFSVLSIEDLGQLAEPKKPALPIKGTMIGIPQGAQPSLKILVDETQRGSLANPPISVPTPRVDFQLNKGLPQITGYDYAVDPAIYNSNRLFPTDAARIESSGNLRSQRFLVVQFFPLQFNPVTRELVFHRRIRIEVSFTYPQGRSPQAVGSSVKEGLFEAILQQSISNYSSAQNWRTPSRAPLAPTRSPREYTGGPWFKIAVNADGIYQVTCPDLRNAGLNPSGLNSNTLQLFDQGNELAINVVGTWASCNTNDYIEFFGQGLNTKYTDTNIYWLTHGSATGKRMPQRNGSGGITFPTTFTDTIHLEENKTYNSSTPEMDNADHWYWTSAGPLGGNPNASFSVQLDNFASSVFSATLNYSVSGYNTGGHRTRIFINGTLIEDAPWSGKSERIATITFPQSILQVGANTITVNEPDSGDLIFINYFNLGYQSTFNASNDSLRFNQATTGNWRYQIGNFSESTAKVFDITDPYSVTQFVNTSLSLGPPYTLQFGDSSTAPRNYFALTSAKRKNPISITQDVVSNLHSTTNAADYIIISYGEFIPDLQVLETFRQAQGLRTQIVDVQDIYDEFNDGSMDPLAIRNFLAFTYSSWSQNPAPPSLVLLVGDSTLDVRGYCTSFCPDPGYTTPPNSTFIPPYLRFVDPTIGETASDNRLVSFQDGTGNTLPQMAIGRLPANNITEVNTMVSKILNYEQNSTAGIWRSLVTFIADNAYFSDGSFDGAGNFWDFSDAIASNPLYMPNGMFADRIYYNPCNGNTNPNCALPYAPYPTVASANAAINSAINNGRLIVSYVGHAGVDVWSSESPSLEHLYTTNDIPNLVNGFKLPVILAMTCQDGFFIHPNYASMAETFLRSPGKGAVASWSATGWGYTQGHDFLERGFFGSVINVGVRQLGPATIAGDTYLWANSNGSYRDLIDTYMLFGDPASRLQLQFTYYYLPFIRK